MSFDETMITITEIFMLSEKLLEPSSFEMGWLRNDWALTIFVVYKLFIGDYSLLAPQSSIVEVVGECNYSFTSLGGRYGPHVR